VAALKDLLTGKLSCLCGQSGGGKSSLLNAILGHDANDTSAVSLRSERGRHTTRHTEIFTLGADTFIIDTPGFSFLEPEGIDCKELDLYFPDLLELGVRCKYPRCTHRGEPECAVKTAVEQGAFSRERLERFVKLYGELHEMSGKY
jgi:ribosome biogenesis GTPase